MSEQWIGLIEECVGCKTLNFNSKIIFCMIYLNVPFQIYSLTKFTILKILLFILGVFILLACIKVYYVHLWVPTEEKGVGFPRTGLTDSCKPPYGCWGPNLGPQEQQMLLTLAVSPTPKLTISGLPNLLRLKFLSQFRCLLLVDGN